MILEFESGFLTPEVIFQITMAHQFSNFVFAIGNRIRQKFSYILPPSSNHPYFNKDIFSVYLMFFPFFVCVCECIYIYIPNRSVYLHKKFTNVFIEPLFIIILK